MLNMLLFEFGMPYYLAVIYYVTITMIFNGALMEAKAVFPSTYQNFYLQYKHWGKTK